MNKKISLTKFFLACTLMSALACSDDLPQTSTSAKFPEPVTLTGKISFTFDDGPASVFEYALPVFEARNVSATAYITTGWIGRSGYMSWEQVQSLQDDHSWEIGSHTLSHPELPNLLQADIDKELGESKTILTNRGLQVTSMATPFGAYDNRVLKTSSRLYAHHRGFWDTQDLNRFPYNNTVLMVKAINRDTPTSEVFAYIDQAILEKKWLILVFHEILPYPINYVYTTHPDVLASIVDYAIDSGIEIVLPRHELEYEKYNLINQHDEINIWTMDSGNIEFAPSETGRFPHTSDAFLFTGTALEIHLDSPKIRPSPTNANYRFKCFVDTTELTQGAFGIYIREFSQNNEQLASVYFGAIASGSITELQRNYQIQDSNTAYLKIQSYLSAGAVGRVISDQYQLFSIK
ncbi:MAG: polysaccharide deacetylase family protein [Gammaproteobacteria bacterium]|nr:polysaccharide deacetylase family protein [Gammaproteobacteria bacterium]MDH5800634.1 polysaccharide deacetylase family protein [Gammaproteobacteria bacterium]